MSGGKIDVHRIGAHFPDLPINILSLVRQALDLYPVFGKPKCGQLFGLGFKRFLHLRNQSKRRYRDVSFDQFAFEILGVTFRPCDEVTVCRRQVWAEPRRICWRLQLLSRMEHHEQDTEQVFPRNARTCSAAGVGERLINAFGFAEMAV